ncbi:MAG: serine O-acetyltransferase [Alphaproteobacteria bacterium]|nr:serine O-acetyltransferase [Alphaproteobacteria bacterium]
MFGRLRDHIDSIIARDPAARSRAEVLLCYPGLHAVLMHRLAHGAWRRSWHLVGRCLSHVGRVLTGIEIHPGAVIGERLFVDHGMGVVIGETAVIGDDVYLYQGVTLGGTSSEKGKRHPTLGDGVIVGSGAAILGPFTVGAGARVGANSVVLRAVPAGVTVVGSPAQVAKGREPQTDKADFAAYGIPGGVSDPVSRAIDGLLDEVHRLSARVAALEAEGQDNREDDDTPPASRARAGVEN